MFRLFMYPEDEMGGGEGEMAGDLVVKSTDAVEVLADLSASLETEKGGEDNYADAQTKIDSALDQVAEVRDLIVTEEEANMGEPSEEDIPTE